MRDRIQINRHNEGLAAQASGGKCRLTAGMARPDHYHVVFSSHFKNDLASSLFRKIE
jgi:hypothetical protein